MFVSFFSCLYFVYGGRDGVSKELLVGMLHFICHFSFDSVGGGLVVAIL